MMNSPRKTMSTSRATITRPPMTPPTIIPADELESERRGGREREKAMSLENWASGHVAFYS